MSEWCAVCADRVISECFKRATRYTHQHLPAQIHLALLVEVRELVLARGGHELLGVRVQVGIRHGVRVHEGEDGPGCTEGGVSACYRHSIALQSDLNAFTP